ncbi:MAG: flagellar export chaperone FliS [Gammaproteobacteria bacterium]|nr:flagellar export chaperone FliS [Gammaproteobacteria bacterium]NNF60025.1 flagellar export chaperone FliS [Gammaproteobacteria bacterium]NNM19956.1 flagellar export chaperone FliS [Gammaproteobacteria bacterium]
MNNDVSQYQQVSAHGGVAASDPHQLILLLMNGALDAIAVAKGHLRRGEVAGKGANISRAISIIDGLRGSLDHEIGGDLVANLDELYVYMGQRLLQANLRDNADWLDEVSGLLREIKEAWEQIPPEARKVTREGLDAEPAAAAEEVAAASIEQVAV